MACFVCWRTCGECVSEPSPSLLHAEKIVLARADAAAAEQRVAVARPKRLPAVLASVDLVDAQPAFASPRREAEAPCTPFSLQAVGLDAKLKLLLAAFELAQLVEHDFCLLLIQVRPRFRHLPGVTKSSKLSSTVTLVLASSPDFFRYHRPPGGAGALIVAGGEADPLSGGACSPLPSGGEGPDAEVDPPSSAGTAATAGAVSTPLSEGPTALTLPPVA